MCFSLLSSGRLSAHVFLRITEKVYYSPILLGLFWKSWSLTACAKFTRSAFKTAFSAHSLPSILFLKVTFITRLCYAVSVILRYSLVNVHCRILPSSTTAAPEINLRKGRSLLSGTSCGHKEWHFNRNTKSYQQFCFLALHRFTVNKKLLVNKDFKLSPASG